MSDASTTPESTAQPNPVRVERDESPRGVTFRVLASAIKDVTLSEVRYSIMNRPAGLHGETFGPRWEKVRSIVTTHNHQTVTAAWAAAIKAGWTDKDLNAAGLTRP
ncbi:MAG: hypothetical protein ABIW36_01510 [Terrimesophilobacter sp.]